MTKRDVKFFVVGSDKNFPALEDWLKGHNRYNSYTLYQTDKNGNYIVPLRWDRKPDSDWGKVEPVTGIVVVKDKKLYDQVLEIINGHKTK